MTSNLVYTGRVTVKIKNKPPVRKFNSGTSALFDVLLRSIVAPPQHAANECPGYMSLVSSLQIDPSVYVKEELILNNMPLSERRVTSGSAKFTALLNHNNTTSNNIPDKCYIVLLDGKQEHVLAYVEADTQQIQIFNQVKNDSNGQCVIEWEMSFSNNTQQGGSEA